MAIPEDATESGSEDTALKGLGTKVAKLKGALADNCDAAAGECPEDAATNGLEDGITNGLEAKGATLAENDVGDAKAFELLSNEFTGHKKRLPPTRAERISPREPAVLAEVE